MWNAPGAKLPEARARKGTESLQIGFLVVDEEYQRSPVSSVCLSAMRSPRLLSNPLHVEPKWLLPPSLPPLPQARRPVRRNTSNVSRKFNPATREVELRAKRHPGNASGAMNRERPAASTKSRPRSDFSQRRTRCHDRGSQFSQQSSRRSRPKNFHGLASFKLAASIDYCQKELGAQPLGNAQVCGQPDWGLFLWPHLTPERRLSSLLPKTTAPLP